MVMSPSFSNIFGTSPIEPLQEHMTKVTECASQLIPFIACVLHQDWENAKKLQKIISKLEYEADLMKKDLKLHLPSNLFLPMPRSDVLKILDAQDRIANKSEDIAGIIIGRKIVIPESIQAKYQAYIFQCVEATKQAEIAISELDGLLKTGFSGNEVKLISDMIVKLDAIERETDIMQIEIRDLIYKIENDLPPVKCMFLYKLIEWTGELADRAQTVGGQIQLLLAK